MKLDEIVLVLKSSIGSMKNDISSTVSELKKLTSSTSTVTNAMSKVSQTIEPVTKSLNNATNGADTFNKTLNNTPKQSYSQLSNELKSVQKEYDRLNTIMNALKTTRRGATLEERQKQESRPVLRTDNDTYKTYKLADNWQDAENKLASYQQRINSLKAQMSAIQSEGANINAIPTKAM